MAASASSEIFQLTELEEIKVSETDAAFLRELLEDWEKKEESEQQDRTKKELDTTNLNVANAHDINVNHDGPKGAEDQMKVDVFDYIEWPEIAPNSPAVYETVAWYAEEIKIIGRGEFDCTIDYSMLCNEALFEETIYGCLWQD